MAILSAQEMPQSGEWKFGESPLLNRRFIITLDEPGATTPAQITAYLGFDIGSPHPTYLEVPCYSIAITEGYDNSPYHVELVAVYNVPDELIDSPNPLLRRSTWKFETMGQAVPAFYYYGAGGVKYPLTNSAYDFFEGLQTDEAMTRVTITSNLLNFPARLATLATNTINAGAYLFGAARSWKCQGITGELKRELVGTNVVTYWQATSVLMFRASGWDLQLPDMGFNYLSGGQKRRVMTFDFENSEWIPSPVPMGLDGNGLQTFGAPAILTRQVYQTSDFYYLFGVPPG